MCDGSTEADFHRALESALAALRSGILEARAEELGALERGFAARLRGDLDQAHPHGAESALPARHSAISDAAPQNRLAVSCFTSSDQDGLPARHSSVTGQASEYEPATRQTVASQASEYEPAARQTVASELSNGGRLTELGPARYVPYAHDPPELAACVRSGSTAGSSDTMPTGDSRIRRGPISKYPGSGNTNHKLSVVMSKLKFQDDDDGDEKGEVWEMLEFCKNRGVLTQGSIALVIMANAITIGLSTDISPESPAWLVVDAVFAAIFIVEMLIKMRPGLREYFCGVDRRWNVFELLLVVLAVSELVMATLKDSAGDDTTTMLSIFRIVRLARIFRIARLARLQIFKDLFIMFTAASGGVKTLLWAILLIALPIYVLALVLTEILGRHADMGNGAECFANLRMSFFTVFRCIVAGDCSTTDGRPIFYLVTLEYGWIYSFIYYISIMVMCFGFFNVITAVFIDNIMTSAKFSDTQKKYERLLDADRFSQKAADLVEFVWNMHMNSPDATASTEALDIEHAMNLQITPPFFDRMMGSQGFKEILRSLDIAYEDQLDLFETLDVDGGGTIDMQELILGISKLRGDARRTDVIGISLIVRAMQSELALIRHHLEMPKSKLRRARQLANMGSSTSLMGATPSTGMSTLETTGLVTHTV